ASGMEPTDEDERDISDKRASGMEPTDEEASAVSSPSEDVQALIDEARTWPRDGINEGPLINALADALEASAVSSPPTITDEVVDIVQFGLYDDIREGDRPVIRRV